MQKQVLLLSVTAAISQALTIEKEEEKPQDNCCLVFSKQHFSGSTKEFCLNIDEEVG